MASVTSGQREAALISEENRMPVADLPVLAFSGECQLSCTVLGYWDLMLPLWSLILCMFLTVWSETYTGSPLEVML